MTRKPARLLVLAVTAAATAAVAPAPAQAAVPYCGITWGSTAKVSSVSSAGTVEGVRAGRHACFDRLVVDLDGHATFGAYDVRYVSQVQEDGSGRAVPVRGAADLQVVLGAPAYDQEGDPTFDPANDTEVVDLAGYSTFRQVAWAGSYEGYTTIALGVRARLPFRAFVLAGTSSTGPRLVIDVAHRW
ncbi:hypothetical protein [Blastococcus sp. CCUG 61487]|uniref:AMIN-like domain-containing (lipo)protein n=1 Tax=Blastococcus sp. CCUG 61487 TaxID=1840703 RepID=UPI0010BF89B4|nr:hypothetical protein [Blastococcus sp. CCUG 61487]TKJ18809.1 hypothetical protein A6V29_11095 [Blastococcus sp. CCUG 61487]